MEATPPEQQALRDMLMSLAQKKKEIEDEMISLTTKLVQSGAGVKGSLVDEEGFPREDITDLYGVTHMRNRRACLQTDLN
jgi:26S proteasome non-ATPase regulatory subunit 9